MKDMKTRKFKLPLRQSAYDHFRMTMKELIASGPDHLTGKFLGGTALQGAYKRGILGHKNTEVPTSVGQAAHAAGLDNRADLLRYGR